MIFNVFRPKRQRDGKSAISRMYRGRYRLDGDSRLTDVPLHTNDKQVARQRLEQIVRDRQREREGIIPPKHQRDAAQRPLTGHIADFIADRNTVGCDARYVRELEKKLLRLAGACGWNCAGDVTPNSFQTWRDSQKRAAKTLNEYLKAASGLMNWMERGGRIAGNPLKPVQMVQSGGLQTRVRRALTLDELKRLMAVAGPRKAIYATAVFTGLRRGELGKLEWRDVNLDAACPFLNVRASTTKNHKQASLPVHADVVAALRTLRPAEAEPLARVFPRLPTMKRFRMDLAAANIEFLDAKGEHADFHALRKTFATHLTLAGTPQRVTMELMRHSDMRLTAKTYTDAGLLPIGDAALSLPSISDCLSQGDSQSSVAGGLPPSIPVTENEVSNSSGTRMNKGFGHDLTPMVQGSPKTANGVRYRLEACPTLSRRSTAVARMRRASHGFMHERARPFSSRGCGSRR